ncbi:hypothetical protein BVY04_01105, partial [bacterium M21]
MKTRILPFVLLVLAASLTGCLTKSWEAQWPHSQTAPTPDASVKQETAQKLFEQADTELRLLNSINAPHDAVTAAPTNREILAMLGNQYILLGTAYTSKRSEKTAYFRTAMKYCEWSLYTNPDFRAKVDAGAKPWEAARTLTKEDAPAMLFWATALQYEFKEGMSLPAKIVNVGWMKYALAFLDRIQEVAPTYSPATVEFARTICLFALPTFQGGNKELGKQAMAKALSGNPDWLFSRWARGKYYYRVTDNPQG